VFSTFTRWHWFDPIPYSSLILGAVPSQQLLVQLQREYRVEDIVNMCAEFQGHLETMKELGLVQCWIPTRDFHTPTLESIWVGVRFISKCEARWQELPEAERGRIYIHCKAGRGRSATVAVCWLLFCYKLTVEEAQRVLLKARAQVKDLNNNCQGGDFCNHLANHVSAFLHNLIYKNDTKVDKKIQLHPEVLAFYEEVQEQEGNNTIVRKVWPGEL
ncbi:protein-tyrosine phosphatase-like protein, partial [Dissophora ornata]